MASPVLLNYLQDEVGGWSVDGGLFLDRGTFLHLILGSLFLRVCVYVYQPLSSGKQLGEFLLLLLCLTTLYFFFFFVFTHFFFTISLIAPRDYIEKRETSELRKRRTCGGRVPFLFRYFNGSPLFLCVWKDIFFNFFFFFCIISSSMGPKW